MSLILEALRKLEREKGAPEQRGFVVLGSAGGGGRRPTGRAALAALAAVALGAMGAVAWQRLGAPEPARGPERPPAPTLETVPAPRPTIAPRPAVPSGSGTGAPADRSSPSPTALRRDPAAADPPAASTAPRFRLQAITRRDGRPVALLNDRLVREGDSFDGVRVVRIGEMEVELETPSGSVIVGF